jgi:D-3-phosphoglycerate dehydrogenase
MSKPKVLISDALSPAAVQIFKDRGIEVDFQPNLGKDKEKLAEIIGNYDGLARPPRPPRKSWKGRRG